MSPQNETGGSPGFGIGMSLAFAETCDFGGVSWVTCTPATGRAQCTFLFMGLEPVSSVPIALTDYCNSQWY
jgi:hypothetical protein